MPLAGGEKAMKLDKIHTLVTVQCSHNKSTGPKESHQIAVLTSGELVFFGHGDDLGIEDMMLKKAGLGPAYACTRILRHWVENSYMLLPALKEARAQVTNQKRRERRERQQITDDLVDSTLRQRWTTRVRPIARKLLEKAEYRTAVTTGNGENHFWNLSIGEPHIEGLTEREWDTYEEKNIPKTTISAKVPLRWYKRVYLQDLAIINGSFVLDNLGPRRDGSLVLLVGKQSRGYKVHVRSAVLKKGKLKWL